MCYCNQVGFAQPMLLSGARSRLAVKSSGLSSADVGRVELAEELVNG